jgi:formate dehydrogenase maturation protein FdhE
MTSSMMQPWFPFTFNLPSGDVDLANWFSSNVNVTYAGTPAIERDVVERVASFGKQLGILTDAVLEQAAGAKGEKIARLRELDKEIQAIKDAHKRDAKRQAKEAIERLAKLDKTELEVLLSRYKA